MLETDLPNPNYKYTSNYIKTTKYTLWTFLPLNLWEQFHRFANIYFVFILILNFIPDVGAFAKEVAPIPVIITLSVVAIKDAYEDFRRYLSDRKVNKKPCEVYSVHEKQYVIDEWQSLHPGDFIRLHTNDIIPADILLLATSNSTGICHIETSNLDGESNLKQREVITGLSDNSEFSPLNFLYPIEVEIPSAELYKFHGKIILPEVRIPIHKKNMLLRGCVLRNTDFVEGIINENSIGSSVALLAVLLLILEGNNLSTDGMAYALASLLIFATYIYIYYSMFLLSFKYLNERGPSTPTYY
ncbi:unnamed protein product [Heterobilharzia americana]|nr:unnamed protein product [Heterobilharzia americana]